MHSRALSSARQAALTPQPGATFSLHHHSHHAAGFVTSISGCVTEDPLLESPKIKYKNPPRVQNVPARMLFSLIPGCSGRLYQSTQYLRRCLSRVSSQQYRGPPFQYCLYQRRGVLCWMSAPRYDGPQASRRLSVIPSRGTCTGVPRNLRLAHRMHPPLRAHIIGVTRTHHRRYAHASSASGAHIISLRGVWFQCKPRVERLGCGVCGSGWRGRGTLASLGSAYARGDAGTEWTYKAH